MPETLLHRDFSAGWCPSDDKINGRPNCLLKMDNLELDQNGALQLIHGTQQLYSGFSGNAHTMFSRFMGGIRYDYSALSDGTIFRNGTFLQGAGDHTNAAFATAFDYVLICSGDVRLKDNGSGGLVNLGVGAPTAAPVIAQSVASTPTAIIGNMQVDFVIVDGLDFHVVAPGYIQVTTNIDGKFIYQTINQTVPKNCMQLTSSSGSGYGTDDDLVIISGYTPDPYGVSLQFDVLLKQGDSAGDTVSDYYTYVVKDVAQSAQFDSITGTFTIRIKRSDFNRVGGAALDWSTVWGYRLSLDNNQAKSSVINIWGATFGDPNFVLRGGTGAQNGTYQYMQVNVNNTGSYLARSEMGPASVPIQLDMVTAQINFQNPTGIDSQVNEVWLYRTGGNLGGTWYRIAVVKPPYTQPVFDNMGDQAALDLNIKYNTDMKSIRSITDKIYDIIGPIQGRWYYFTTNFMYPSEINDPDLINPSIAIRTCGSNNEMHMWARTVSANVVIVGTSVDCYILTGTFSTFPDGTVDIYYLSLGVKFPPVTYDAVSYGGSIYYLRSDGWGLLVPTSFGTTYASQNNQLIVAPNLDRLYRGETCYGYQPPNMPQSPGAVRFPVTIGKNKLWCFPAGTNSRGEVYDFLRQYWRPYNYFIGDVSACTTTQDNKILAFFTRDKVIREIDFAGSKLIDGGIQQSYTALFTYQDNGKPRQRKDTYTFKSRCYTGVSNFGIVLTDEMGRVTTPAQRINSHSGVTETYIDLGNPMGFSYPGQQLPKSYQIQINGTSDDFILEDWSIDFDARPIPLTSLRIYPSNIGSATQKRLRTWPLVIDTLGNNVTFTPEADGLQYAPLTINTTYKKTVFYYFTTDVFAIDYGGILYDPNGLMEVWDTGLSGQGLLPDMVQNLPISHEFDQVGPIEIFRWGKITRMALRTMSQGTPIPFKVYIGDNMIYSGNFNVTPGKEDEYMVDLPKGVSGTILRVELGPCGFTFNRYFMKFQVAISGAQKDTELAWITVPGVSANLAAGI